MQNKATIKNDFRQNLIAGITQDSEGVEFFGIRKSKTVKFLYKGSAYPFNELSPKYYAILSNAFYEDVSAVKFFRKFQISEARKIELWTYYCYGDLDHTPDIIDGKLQPAENFRDSLECPSLQFDSKQITIAGKPLLPRELTIIDMISKDALDIEIAEALNITLSTLGFHKRQLFKKTNTQSRIGLLKIAMQENITQ